MRILYLAFADLAIPKAWTVHIRAVCRCLAAQGHDVFLVTPEPSRAIVDVGVPHLRVGTGWAPRRALMAFHREIWLHLGRWARGHRAEAIYARMIPFAAWLPWRTRALGIPLVVEVNGIVADELRQDGASALRLAAFQATERLQLEGADGVTAVTESIADGLRASYPRIRRVAVVENGADPGAFPEISRDEARTRLGLPSGRWIGFVGGLFRTRELDTLVRAVAKVRERAPDARLLIVGDGPSRGEAEAAARRLQPGVVRFLGEIPTGDVPTAIAALEVGVFLSRLPHAQSPLKVFEYMAARRPVLASSTAGIGAWVEREGVGLSVDASSAESVADGILRLLDRPHLAAEMGARGRALVESHYNWDRCAVETASFLGSVVQRRRQDAGGI